MYALYNKQLYFSLGLFLSNIVKANRKKKLHEKFHTWSDIWSFLDRYNILLAWH